MDRQHNGQEKEKRANNDLHSNMHKTKDRAIRTLVRTGGGLMCTGREVVIAPRVVHTVLRLLQTVLLKISYLLSQCKSIINFFIE